MADKGLCMNCIHDRTCSFKRPTAVVHCEEFDSGVLDKFSRGICCAKNAKHAALMQEEVLAE